jgi:hypothetical protein
MVVSQAHLSLPYEILSIASCLTLDFLSQQHTRKIAKGQKVPVFQPLNQDSASHNQSSLNPQVA